MKYETKASNIGVKRWQVEINLKCSEAGSDARYCGQFHCSSCFSAKDHDDDDDDASVDDEDKGGSDDDNDDDDEDLAAARQFAPSVSIHTSLHSSQPIVFFIPCIISIISIISITIINQ